MGADSIKLFKAILKIFSAIFTSLGIIKLIVILPIELASSLVFGPLY